jgi:hypothetical protein
MTLDDAEHYSDKQRSEIIAQYPEHMKDIRAKGIPSFGAGLIFPVDEKRLLVEPFKCPTHWPKIGALDIGFVHKFAACELWHDRDLDIIYLVKTWAVREQTPLEHAQALRSWKLQFAWPADGRSHTCWRWRTADEAIRRCWLGHDVRARSVRGWLNLS